MLFNSIEFAIFLPVVFLGYWFVFQKDLRLQNFWLLLASYVFYGWWDYRFLSLIFFSTVLDYSISRILVRQKKQNIKKLLLGTSLVANLGILLYFKYCNFFIENFVEVFRFFGAELKISSLQLILPIGISFYTFQTLSYTIDVYRGQIQATRSFISFMAFVSFFPQLVAGPIERAKNLLPQMEKKRNFTYTMGVDGLRLILWGAFKKVVIADNCAFYVNEIFGNIDGQDSGTLFFGALFFTFQIYGDFSGYSDMAIGVAKLFGFSLKKNFNSPYFSRDIAEFWRKWHISLSTWFKDYLYIPLGGSKGGRWMQIRNTFFVFLVSGFWHGANWTFVVWGGLNAILYLPLLLRGKNRSYSGENMLLMGWPNFVDFVKMVFTFGAVMCLWVVFRVESISDGVKYLSMMVSHPGAFLLPSVWVKYKLLLVFIMAFIAMEWFGRNGEHTLGKILYGRPKFVRYTFYYILFLCLVWYPGNQQEFIYFQF